MTKQDCFDKLKEISEYKENWNGYEAEPFDKGLIEKCKFILGQLVVCPEIYPTADNSIQFEHHSNEMYIALEIFPTRSVIFCRADGKWVNTELHSDYQAIDWWNVLTAMAKG